MRKPLLERGTFIVSVAGLTFFLAGTLFATFVWPWMDDMPVARIFLLPFPGAGIAVLWLAWWMWKHQDKRYVDEQ